MSDANIHEIYNLLYIGKTIRMGFSTEKEAESFRVRVAQLKLRQDRQLESLVGPEGAGEVKSFSFQIQASLNSKDPSLGPAFVATMQFKDKSVERKYSFVILEDEEERDTGEDEQEIREGLGKDQTGK